MRESDNVTSTPRSIDLTGIAGWWSSSEPQPRGIGSIEITVRDGAAQGHTFGAGQNGLIDWGVVPVSTLFTDGVSSTTCAGFQLRYDLAFLTSHIQGNLKLGVMVLGVYQSFRGSSGRHNYFFREFLAVTESEFEPTTSALGDRSCVHDAVLGESTAAVECLLGSWRNTNHGSSGIAWLELEAFGDQIRVRVRGAGANGMIDWGESSGEAFTCSEEDATPSAAVVVRYDFGFFDCDLQIRQNKGILAVTTFNRFHDDSGRSDYVIRELFHRSSRSSV